MLVSKEGRRGRAETLGGLPTVCALIQTAPRLSTARLRITVVPKGNPPREVPKEEESRGRPERNRRRWNHSLGLKMKTGVTQKRPQSSRLKKLKAELPRTQQFHS